MCVFVIWVPGHTNATVRIITLHFLTIAKYVSTLFSTASKTCATLIAWLCSCYHALLSKVILNQDTLILLQDLILNEFTWSLLTGLLRSLSSQVLLHLLTHSTSECRVIGPAVLVVSRIRPLRAKSTVWDGNFCTLAEVRLFVLSTPGTPESKPRIHVLIIQKIIMGVQFLVFELLATKN